MPKQGSTAAPAKKTSAPARPSASASGNGASGANGNLEITDTRTSKKYTVPVAEGAIRATDLKKLKTDDPDDTGLMSYDPAFLNTAACRSAITYIDGDKGILRYRGYPIEQLAESSTFLEVAWLLRHGELPDQKEYDKFVHDINFHTYV
ncbi:MAG TPA: citrate/2-methylcitrate synthase, partial [Gemmatimonadaceae bacterium]|nr:citrate/2-methylcitrate synthase [Gemmatimonadaceae bacterium]